MLRGVPIVLLVLACAGAPRESTAPAPPGQRTIAGMYSYMADAATFTRCDTGALVPVAMEGESIALEREYLAAAHEPGAPVFVTVQGRFETRPPMEGEPREHLIVDKFDAIWPDEVCEKLGVETPLQNTYWKLVELNGAPVRPREGQREVHLMLPLEGPGVRGFAGCNTFAGACVVDGDAIRFEEVVATLMACDHMEEESAFLTALNTVTGYRILGETLVLSGAGGRVARLRAVYF
ncbi:MAG TPA: META domain-containing protein [Candidatus Krumholzibacteria bacterium]|nr:META domain-containing protein [Candidatus Krumholzibacteria bacterium]